MNELCFTRVLLSLRSYPRVIPAPDSTTYRSTLVSFVSRMLSSLLPHTAYRLRLCSLVMSAVSRRVTRLPSASGLSPLQGVEREEACNQGNRRQEMCKVKVDRAHLSHVVSLISFQSSRSTFLISFLSLPFHSRDSSLDGKVERERNL